MGEGRIVATLPRLPAAEFFRDANHSIKTADGSALLSYDPATRAGFIYYLESCLWVIAAPVDFAVFALQASALGLSIEEGEDAARWFDACSCTPRAPAMAPASTRH